MSGSRAKTVKTHPSGMVSVRISPLDPRRAHVRFGPLHFHAALGKGGVTAFKREGDGATPLGRMAVLSGFRSRRDLSAVVSPIGMSRVGKSAGWCDEPGHAAYNHPVRLPFAASHEKLLREDCLYDFVLVLDWNISSRKRGAGSAIFFHVAKPGYPPTQGCIALARRDMIRLLPHLRRGTMVKIFRG